MRTTLTPPDDRNQFFYNKYETSMKVGNSSIYLLENELQTGIISISIITTTIIPNQSLIELVVKNTDKKLKIDLSYKKIRVVEQLEIGIFPSGAISY